MRQGNVGINNMAGYIVAGIKYWRAKTH